MKFHLRLGGLQRHLGRLKTPSPSLVTSLDTLVVFLYLILFHCACASHIRPVALPAHKSANSTSAATSFCWGRQENESQTSAKNVDLKIVAHALYRPISRNYRNYGRVYVALSEVSGRDRRFQAGRRLCRRRLSITFSARRLFPGV